MNIKKLRELKKNKKGFTLIEIIVVVVILAVLMAVAVPSVMKYLSEADNAKYMAQARTVMTTAQAEMAKAYAGDKKIDAEEWAAMISDTAKAEGTINTWNNYRWKAGGTEKQARGSGCETHGR